MTYDLKTNDLVSNPVPELLSLRGASVASEQKVALAANSVHHVEKTAGGAAASADIEVNFTVPQVCISEVRFGSITSKGRFELAPNPACLPAWLNYRAAASLGRASLPLRQVASHSYRTGRCFQIQMRGTLWSACLATSLRLSETHPPQVGD